MSSKPPSTIIHLIFCIAFQFNFSCFFLFLLQSLNLFLELESCQMSNKTLASKSTENILAFLSERIYEEGDEEDEDWFCSSPTKIAFLFITKVF